VDRVGKQRWPRQRPSGVQGKGAIPVPNPGSGAKGHFLGEGKPMKSFLAMALALAFTFSNSPADAQERWVCAFPHKLEPTMVFTHFTVDGDFLKASEGLDYRILENNEFSIVAVWSMSKIWTGNTEPRMGAAVVVIDKTTGKYRRSSVYVGEFGDDSVYGKCERDSSGVEFNP
jgi:hypothetical protein